TLRVNSPSFSGRTVPLFESMLVTIGEGSGTSTEPHHTPSPEAQQTSPIATSSPSLPPVTTESIPTVIPTDSPQLRHYTRRARIAQSSALSPIVDEPASPIGDDSQGESCPTISGLKAEQDRTTITKTSTLTNDSTPRVTSLAADERSMQHKLTELMELYTRLIKHLEDRDGGYNEPFGEDATIKGRRPSSAIESNSNDFQNRNSSIAKIGASSSTILSKPAIKFVKSADRPTETKTDKVETANKPAVKYAKMYKKTSKSSNVRGNQRN
nr:hypothetical protein [Tanacetum cinerariifolium]